MPKKNKYKYISPNLNSREFKDEVLKLEKKGVHLKKENSILLEYIEKETIPYEKEVEALGEGAHGVAYLFVDPQKKYSNKVVKTNKIVNDWLQFISNLEKEYKKVKEDVQYEHKYLIKIMRYQKKEVIPSQQQIIQEKIDNLQKKLVNKEDLEEWYTLYLQYSLQKKNVAIDDIAPEYEYESSMLQKVYGDTEHIEQFRVAMPFLAKKTVKQFLAEGSHTLLELLDLLINISITYDFLHTQYEIAQIDLKFDNMLIDDEKCIWLCDMEHSAKFGENIKIDIDYASSAHYGPEIKRGAKVSASMDVHALGWSAKNRILPYMQRATDFIKMHNNSQFVSEFNAICDAMLERKPENRQVTLNFVKNDLLKLRSKYLPTAPKFVMKLNPIFSQKKAIREMKLDIKLEAVKLMLSNKYGINFVMDILNRLHHLKKWDILTEILETHYDKNKEIFHKIILTAVEEKEIPKAFVREGLNYLVEGREWRLIKSIIKTLAQQNKIEKLFEMAIINLAIENQWELVKLLAENKAPQSMSIIKNGYSILHLVVNKKQYDVMKVLLDAGAFADQQHKGHQTPLHVAIDNGDAKAAELLLKYPVNFLKIYQNQNMLEYAINKAKEGNWDIVKLFLLDEKLPKKIYTEKVILALYNSKQSDVIQLIPRDKQLENRNSSLFFQFWKKITNYNKEENPLFKSNGMRP